MHRQTQNNNIHTWMNWIDEMMMKKKIFRITSLTCFLTWQSHLASDWSPYLLHQYPFLFTRWMSMMSMCSSDCEWCSKWEVWRNLTYYIAQSHVQMTHWTVISLVVFYYWLIWLVYIMISESISLSFGQTTRSFISLRRQFLVFG